MRDFYWPLPLEASVPVREFLYAQLVPLVREADREDPDALVLRVVHQYLIMGTLQLFEAAALAAAFERDGVRPELPCSFAMLRALVQGSPVPCEHFESQIGGPPLGRRVPVFVKRLVRGAQWNRKGSPLRLARALLPSAGVRDIITPDVNGLLQRHALRERRVLRFSPYTDWFGPMPAADLDRAGRKRLTSLLARAVALVEESFVTGGLDPNPFVSEWAQRWLGQAGAFVRFQWAGLNNRRLPREMWFGCTGSSIWGRMLSVAVHAQGGRVTSHDHGYGNAQIEQSGHHFTEFHFSDEFHTYNRLQAEVRRQEIRPELLLDPVLPAITSPPLGQARVPKPGEARSCRRRGPIRRLLYLPTAFHGMRTRLRPIIPDPVALDFQARLFGRLREWGIDVLYKPHPEGASRPPAGFAEDFGFEMDIRRFEQINWPCDAYLVDFLSSSTTRQVLTSDLPVIFLAMPYPELLPEARALLERRCSFVRITFGPDNRAHADWGALRAILEAEEHEFEMTFPDAYYVGTT